MRIRPFQAVYPRLDYITSTDSFFQNVKQDYPEFKASGFFNKTSKEGMYLYQIVTPERTYQGVIACVDIREYLEGRIKKHENTLPEKEQRQIHLLLRRNAMVKPVLLTYPRVKEIDTFIQNFMDTHDPFMEVTFEQANETHRFWEVQSGQNIQYLEQLFAEHISHTYIADGHHRSSILALMHKRGNNPGGKHNYDSLLSAFFPASELEILEYNRVVEGLNELSLTTFMAMLSKVVDIEVLTGPAKPADPRQIVMFLNKEWFLLSWKPAVLAAYPEEEILLDIHLLNREIFQNILGIEDIRADPRIRYVEGPDGLEQIREKVLRSDKRIGFVLPPVAMEDFLHIADQGKILPPKSTWFEPRMRNGLISQEF